MKEKENKNEKKVRKKKKICLTYDKKNNRKRCIIVFNMCFLKKKRESLYAICLINKYNKKYQERKQLRGMT